MATVRLSGNPDGTWSVLIDATIVATFAGWSEASQHALELERRRAERIPAPRPDPADTPPPPEPSDNR